MEKLFKLQENGTTVKTELLAGLTTFMTMAYIIALNPNLLTNFAVGTPLWNGVFLATCIASAIGTICMAFMANKPFVMAPGMGLNSFFAVVVANIAVINNCEYESAFQAGLVIILVEGIVFLVLTGHDKIDAVAGIRNHIFNQNAAVVCNIRMPHCRLHVSEGIAPGTFFVRRFPVSELLQKVFFNFRINQVHIDIAAELCRCPVVDYHLYHQL